jgi:hypothetical protein
VETERGGPAQVSSAPNVHRFLPYYGRLARTAVREVAGGPAVLGRIATLEIALRSSRSAAL